MHVRSVVGILMVCVGCGSNPVAVDEDDSRPDTDLTTIADLVGSWTASSQTFTNNANAAESYDLIANGGETRFTMLTGGGVRTWVTFGTFSDEWDSQASMSGSTLTVDPVEAGRETRIWAFTLEGTVLTVTDATSEFDFTLSGAAEVSATEAVVFIRQ